MTLEEIRQKHPRANHAPRENCKYCNGTGDRIDRPHLPCICIYVDHSMCDFARESLSSVAKKMRKELESNR